MLFRQITDSELAQYAYLIGCQRTGEALLIDPERDIDRYVAEAADEGLRITTVAETHIHADFLSGARQFGREGARIVVSDCGPEDWKVEWARRDDIDVLPVVDGDSFHVGNIRVDVIHTPGHTPEHISFLVTDEGGGAGSPMGIASGDFVFVGDLGRPDLLETAAGSKGAMEPAAHDLYASLSRFLELPDEVQVWPGHGAGSACGKALGAVPISTVGYERRYNASIEPSRDSESAFVRAILTDQPEPPYYFGRMKRLNREGPPLLDALPSPRRLPPEDVPTLQEQGAVVIDTRPERAGFLAHHLPGSLYAPGSTLSTIAGSYLEPEEPIVVVAPEDVVDSIARRLVRIGLDEVIGYVVPEDLEGSDAASASIPRRTFSDLGEDGLRGATVLDVRRASEFEAGHLPGAVNIAHTRLLPRFDEVPEGPLVVHCQSGARAASAASMLARRGRDVTAIDDDFANAPR